MCKVTMRCQTRTNSQIGTAFADGLEHACGVRVQTPGLRILTDAACMPDLAVEEYGGEEACKDHSPESCYHCCCGSGPGPRVESRFQAILGAIHT